MTGLVWWRLSRPALRSLVLGSTVLLSSMALAQDESSAPEEEKPDGSPITSAAKLSLDIDGASEAFTTVNGGLSIDIPVFRLNGEVFHAKYRSGNEPSLSKRGRAHAGLGRTWNEQWFGRLELIEYKARNDSDVNRNPNDYDSGLRMNMRLVGADGTTHRLVEVSTKGSVNRYGLLHNTEYRFTNQATIDIAPVVQPIDSGYGGIDLNLPSIGTTFDQLKSRTTFTVTEPDGTRITYSNKTPRPRGPEQLNSVTNETEKYKTYIAVANTHRFYPVRIEDPHGRGTKIEYHGNTAIPRVVTQCQWIGDSCRAEARVFFHVTQRSSTVGDQYIDQICYPGPNSVSRVDQSSDWNCTSLGYLAYKHPYLTSSPTTLRILNSVTFEGDTFGVEFGSLAHNNLSPVKRMTFPRGASTTYDWFLRHDDRQTSATTLKGKTLSVPGQADTKWRYRANRKAGNFAPGVELTVPWKVTLVEEPIGNGKVKTSAFFHNPNVHETYNFYPEGVDWIFDQRNPLAGRLVRVLVYDGSIIDEVPQPFVGGKIPGKKPLLRTDYGFKLMPIGRSGFYLNKTNSGFIEYMALPAFESEVVTKGGATTGKVTLRRDQSIASRLPATNAESDYDRYGQSGFDYTTGVTGDITTWQHTGCEATACTIRFDSSGAATMQGCEAGFLPTTWNPAHRCANDAIEFTPSGPSRTEIRSFVRESGYLSRNLLALTATQTVYGTTSENSRAEKISETRFDYDHSRMAYPADSVGDSTRTVRGRLTAMEELDVKNPGAPSRIVYRSYFSPQSSEPGGEIAAEAIRIDDSRVRAKQFSYITPAGTTERAGPAVTRELTDSGVYTLTNRTTYSVYGDPLLETDENAQTTRYTYDNKGRETSRTVPGTSSPTYETSYLNLTYGMTVRETAKGTGHTQLTVKTLDALSRPIETQRDSDAGRIAQQTRYLGYTDNPVSVTAGGTTTTTEYDLFTRPTRITVTGERGTTVRTETIYGETDTRAQLGQQIKIDAQGEREILEYDAMRRLVTQTLPDLSRVGYRYDADSRVTLLTHPDGERTVREYTSFGQLSRVTRPESGTTAITYQLDGLISQKVSANNNVVDFHYDTRGRKVSEVYGDGETITFTYDAAVAGAPITQTYLAGRLSQVAHHGGVETLSYDVRGNVNRQAIALDGLAVKIAETSSNSLDQLESMHYQRGSVDALALRYSYGKGGEIREVIDDLSGDSVSRWSFDIHGRLVNKTVGDGVQSIDFTYDDLGRPTDINDVDDNGSSGSDAFALRYGYSASTRVPGATTRNDEVPAYVLWNSARNSAAGYRLSYDNKKQITAAQFLNTTGCGWGDACSGSLNEENANSFAVAGYDLAGGIQEITRYSSTGTPKTVSHQYGGGTSMRHLSGLSGSVSADFNYDLAGNLTGDTRWGDNASMKYSQRNRLFHISEGNTDMAFIYDHQDRRVSSKTRHNPTRTTAYASLNQTAALRVDAAPAPEPTLWQKFKNALVRFKNWVLGADPEPTLAYAKMSLADAGSTTYESPRTLTPTQTSTARVEHTVYVGSQRMATYTDGKLDKLYLGKTAVRTLSGENAGTVFFVNDFIGTPRVAVHESGRVISAFDYDPFGERLSGRSWINNDSADRINTFGFAGYERHDNEQSTPFYYATHRFYDPTTARFMRPDPMASLEPTLSAYAYARNNPYAVVDPTGLRNLSWTAANSSNLSAANSLVGNLTSGFQSAAGCQPTPCGPMFGSNSATRTLLNHGHTLQGKTPGLSVYYKQTIYGKSKDLKINGFGASGSASVGKVGVQFGVGSYDSHVTGSVGNVSGSMSGGGYSSTASFSVLSAKYSSDASKSHLSAFNTSTYTVDKGANAQNQKFSGSTGAFGGSLGFNVDFSGVKEVWNMAVEYVRDMVDTGQWTTGNE